MRTPNLSTKYLGRIDKENKNKLRAEESFPISECGYTSSRLLDGTECQLLLDTGASKSFYVKIILHALQVTPLIAKFASKNTGRKWSVC